MMTDTVDTAALDAWLAHRLLGWSACLGRSDPRSASLSSADVHVWNKPDEPEYGNMCGWLDGRHTERQPALSTTGDGMIQVIEAMRKRLKTYCSITAEPGPWNLVEFTRWDVDADKIAGSGLSHAQPLPLAVAQAARAALEAK